MARTEIRMFKKALHAGSAPEATVEQMADARNAALSLLQHSVRLGHKQLALMRLVDAVNLRVDIDASIWEHCLAAARSLQDEQEVRSLHALRIQSTQRLVAAESSM